MPPSMNDQPTSKQTDTPWTVGPSGYTIHDGTGQLIGVMTSDAYAEVAVSAVNDVFDE